VFNLRLGIDMKYLLLLSFLLTGSVYGQEFPLIKEKGFTGYVCPKECVVLKSIKDEKERYTPSTQDIENAENILLLNKTYLKEKQTTSARGNPAIYKNLPKYIRQYVGFINSSGDKIIWINFILKKEIKYYKPNQDIVHVNDGGSSYWSINVNVNKGYLSNMDINGEG
jgi:hypothetical protein